MNNPPDIDEIAKRTATIILAGYQMAGATDEAIAKAEKIRDKVAEIISKPLYQERRRCAAIAFTYADMNGMSHENDSIGAAVEEVCFAIVKEIRAGTGPAISEGENT